MQRNKFSLSHYKLLTMNMGLLYPVTWFETIPGDSIQQATSALIRCSPLNAPVMHPCRVRVHHWWVPLSQLWDDYEDFFTGGELGTSTPTVPHHDLGTVSEGDLLDYMGIPPAAYGGGGAMEVSALPARAYQHIWNEFYRDQQEVTEAVVSTASGADSTTEIDVKNIAWEKDYFTTARDDETLGTTISIPLTGDAPIMSESVTEDPAGYYNVAALSAPTGTPKDWGTDVVADLSSVSGVDINDLRLALALQRFQENRNQYGARYPELLQHLGIRPDDRSLSRPLYLSGGRQTISFSEILASADTGSYSVGDMVGHGIGAMRTRKYRKFFSEHGICMTLISVLPKTIYASGIDRSWLRTVKEEYFVRELQHLGEQVVYNKETYSQHSTPDGTFGYQARYDEYRGIPSGIAGEFRSSLDHWHLARIFTGDTALNSSFIQASPTTRVYQSGGTDQLYVMANNSIQARRPIIKRGKAMTF